MGLLRRTPVEPLPLSLPRRDGSTWHDATARRSFAASTTYEVAVRRAHDPDARALADRLLAAALPRLDTGVDAADAPYLRKTFETAARLGAALGLGDPSPPGQLDRDTAGALGAARRGLPAMQRDWALLAAWFLLAGHYLARHDEPARAGALAALVEALQT